MTTTNNPGIGLDKPEDALAAITNRLALTYRICCGTAPKQSVGELLDVTIKMPEWEIVRAALARQAAPEAPTCQWPTCQPEEVQQQVAKEVHAVLYGDPAATTASASGCDECAGSGKCGPDDNPKEMDCEVCNGSGRAPSQEAQDRK